MKLIRPTAIADSMLASSSIPENDHTPWNNSATYSAGQRVIRGHRRWESVAGGNTGNDPLTTTAKWINLGSTNRWAMFDRAVGSLALDEGEIDVTLNPGQVDALAIVDTDAELVTVTVNVAGAPIYGPETKSTNAGGKAINDWFLYFFEAVGKVRTLTFLDLPVYANASIDVKVIGPDPDGLVGVGTLIVGRQLDLGTTLVGAKVGIIDFSRKVTDDYGVTDVVERAWSKRMSGTVLCDTAAVDSIQRTLAELRAIPVLWLGEQGYDSLTVYGFYKEFDIDITYSNLSYCSLTIEGLT